MVKHFVLITAIVVVVCLVIFFPYLPGDYDASAVTLSTMAQLFGMTSLLLVPVGLVWLVYELVKKKSAGSNAVTYRFALTTLLVSVIVALVTSLGAFINRSFSLTIITLLLFGYAILKVFIRMRQKRTEEGHNFDVTPYYLIIIPVVIGLARFMFIVPATEFSRDLAIKQSESLIQDIESYHAKSGEYPISLLSLWEDYKPGVVGIGRYHYERNGSSYNLFFKQFSYEFGVEEIVMYNKLDEHQMTSHNQDLLEFTGEQLNAQRGYFGVYDLPTPHWKYFWFD